MSASNSHLFIWLDISPKEWGGKVVEYLKTLEYLTHIKIDGPFLTINTWCCLNDIIEIINRYKDNIQVITEVDNDSLSMNSHLLSQSDHEVIYDVVIFVDSGNPKCCLLLDDFKSQQAVKLYSLCTTHLLINDRHDDTHIRRNNIIVCDVIKVENETISSSMNKEKFVEIPNIFSNKICSIWIKLLNAKVFQFENLLSLNQYQGIYDNKSSFNHFNCDGFMHISSSSFSSLTSSSSPSSTSSSHGFIDSLIQIQLEGYLSKSDIIIMNQLMKQSNQQSKQQSNLIESSDLLSLTSVAYVHNSFSNNDQKEDLYEDFNSSGPHTTNNNAEDDDGGHNVTCEHHTLSQLSISAYTTGGVSCLNELATHLLKTQTHMICKVKRSDTAKMIQNNNTSSILMKGNSKIQLEVEEEDLPFILLVFYPVLCQKTKSSYKLKCQVLSQSKALNLSSSLNRTLQISKVNNINNNHMVDNIEMNQCLENIPVFDKSSILLNKFQYELLKLYKDPSLHNISSSSINNIDGNIDIAVIDINNKKKTYPKRNSSRNHVTSTKVTTNDDKFNDEDNEQNKLKKMKTRHFMLNFISLLKLNKCNLLNNNDSYKDVMNNNTDDYVNEYNTTSRFCVGKQYWQHMQKCQKLHKMDQKVGVTASSSNISIQKITTSHETRKKKNRLGLSNSKSSSQSIQNKLKLEESAKGVQSKNMDDNKQVKSSDMASTKSSNIPSIKKTSSIMTSTSTGKTTGLRRTMSAPSYLGNRLNNLKSHGTGHMGGLVNHGVNSLANFISDQDRRNSGGGGGENNVQHKRRSSSSSSTSSSVTSSATSSARRQEGGGEQGDKSRRRGSSGQHKGTHHIRLREPLNYGCEPSPSNSLNSETKTWRDDSSDVCTSSQDTFLHSNIPSPATSTSYSSGQYLLDNNGNNQQLQHQQQQQQQQQHQQHQQRSFGAGSEQSNQPTSPFSPLVSSSPLYQTLDVAALDRHTHNYNYDINKNGNNNNNDHNNNHDNSNANCATPQKNSHVENTQEKNDIDNEEEQEESNDWSTRSPPTLPRIGRLGQDEESVGNECLINRGLITSPPLQFNDAISSSFQSNGIAERNNLINVTKNDIEYGSQDELRLEKGAMTIPPPPLTEMALFSTGSPIETTLSPTSPSRNKSSALQPVSNVVPFQGKVGKRGRFMMSAAVERGSDNILLDKKPISPTTPTSNDDQNNTKPSLYNSPPKSIPSSMLPFSPKPRMKNKRSSSSSSSSSSSPSSSSTAMNGTVPESPVPTTAFDNSNTLNTPVPTTPISTSTRLSHGNSNYNDNNNVVTQNIDNFIMQNKKIKSSMNTVVNNPHGSLVDEVQQVQMDYIRSKISPLIHEMASTNHLNNGSNNAKTGSCPNGSSISNGDNGGIGDDSGNDSVGISANKLNAAILAAERTAQTILNVKLSMDQSDPSWMGVGSEVIGANVAPILSDEELNDIAGMCFRLVTK